MSTTVRGHQAATVPVRLAARLTTAITRAIHDLTVFVLGFTGGGAGLLVLITTTPILTPLSRLVAAISPGHQLQAYSAAPILSGVLAGTSMLAVLLIVAGGLRRCGR